MTKFKEPFLRDKSTGKKDKQKKSVTEEVSIRILKKDRTVYWCNDRISFEISSTEENNEVSLFYNLLLKEQKKDPEKGEIKYVRSFGMAPLKGKKCRLSIYLNEDVLKKVKTKYDISFALSKVLMIRDHDISTASTTSTD